MRRFVKPVLWTFGTLAAGGLAFGLVLALDIPYRSVSAPKASPAPLAPTAASAPTSPTPPVVPTGPGTMTAWVTDLRPGPDDRSAVLRVDLPACAVGPHVEVTESATRIDAAVLFRPGGGPHCETAPADFPLTAAAAIGKRPVVVNAEDTWGLVSGGWRKCDKILGCEPPADHCDPAWVAQAEFSAEAEYSGTTRACVQDWLIHDLQRHSGQRANRVAYRWAGNGWASFASANGGGCGEILAVEPRFPAALCEKLAPPS
ncbi:hypothetical protein SAMN05421837_102171 [Amycolatopsis pretoriensis]|uniref:Uncharacterized protein n=1 Tax=Amycolatopsis pretoriensis TaxID=218821 RepID=A0A1H5QDF5_9PSEU|nr:hypothetical protein [Amycolatopsis pretoriensis]SEF23431.1 hypothetical protein SAMN05421837_102171 [Amycolatopsis pretoriensis]